MNHKVFLNTLAACCMLGLAATPAFASETNPYAPANGHAYRHGALPTRDVHAKMKHWEAQHALAAQAVATGANTLSFGGGTNGVGVMSGKVKVYVVYYGTQWGQRTTNAKGDSVFTGDASGAAAVTEEMFKGIGTGGELWSADLTQWCDGPNVASGAISCPSNASFVPYQAGGTLAGVWYDNTQASPAGATSGQLANEAIAAAAHFGNTTAASNRYAYYIILSPTGTNPDDYEALTPGDLAYCAWHSGTASNYGDIAFSNQPYNIDQGASCGVGFVNGNGAAGQLDGFTMTLGHEWHEMMSDQLPSGGWTHWVNNAPTSTENSDECAWIAAGSPGGAANVTMGNGTYAEQASWSNDTNSCAISHPIVGGGGGGGTPVANFSDTTSGLTANFTDSSTDTGGTISSHSWTFGDGSTSTATSPSHTYAAAGTYSVTETVTDSVSGKTSSKTASVTVASPGGTPTANFSSRVSGLTATFTDSSTDSGGTIGTHAWTFGDGGTSAVASPSHTYAAAGTYSVTETVTDSVDGKTSAKTASVTVSSGGGSSQLLGNTGFESGSASPWTMTAGVLCTNSTCSGEVAHSGTGFAWLDGYGTTHTDTVSQTVTIPSGKTSATLSYALHIDTQETGSTPYDTLNVQVLNSAGTVLGTLATYSNVNAANGYTVHTANLAAYIGQTVTIKFTGTEDYSLATSFVLDDVTLTVQ
ncbi:MAG TPA: PKD domain-containing protein [Rhodanobacter sp.]|jgi:PKD repeat protein|nr:PKD domain-containing protein [Rhodanobacter sp.]